MPVGVPVMPALYSVTTPAGVIFATLSPASSVNQRLPSGPATIHSGPLLAVMPARYSVTTPAGVIFATLSHTYSANQALPSGPAAIPSGLLPAAVPSTGSVQAAV